MNCFFLRIISALVLVASAPAMAGSGSGSDKLRAENVRPGTKDWMLTKTRVEPTSDFRSPWMEGYCSHQSVEAGQSISFFVSTEPVSEFSVEIYRLGFYQGLGGRLMEKLGPFVGKTQETPATGEKRVKKCAWEASAVWKVPADALSGVYVGKLTAKLGGEQSYVIFIGPSSE